MREICIKVIIKWLYKYYFLSNTFAFIYVGTSTLKQGHLEHFGGPILILSLHSFGCRN